MPTDCTLPENCNNEDCQRHLAVAHEITESKFGECCAVFFSNSVPAPKSVSRDTINTMLYEVDCEVYSIWISANFANSSSNSDITIQVARSAPSSSYTTRYSIAAFRGILLLHNPDTFQFSKAIDSSGNTVIFKALLNGVVKYCGDVGTLYP